MFINGTKDPIVPFDGGHVRLFKFGRSRGEVLLTSASVEHFRLHNRCCRIPEKSQLPDMDPGNDMMVKIFRYTDCKDQADVIQVKVIGDGHTWPGGRQYLNPWLIGALSRDFNASDMTINFFLSHTRKARSAQ